MSSVSELCQRCALCCDGTLFERVALSAAEAEALMARDLAIGFRDDGSPALPQPCAALSGTVCRAYDARPDGCRAYSCLLATALGEGEVSFEEAAAVVSEARAKVAALGGPRAAREELDAYLRRHFTGRHGWR